VCFPIEVEFRRNFEFSTPDPIASGICRTLREDPHDPHCKRSKVFAACANSGKCERAENGLTEKLMTKHLGELQ